QWRKKSAGLRTNTLVALGAAAFTLISYSLTSLEDGVYKGDATRIIGQIVTGIGFLGAGVIMRDGLNVQGLNTAATLWCSASVGAFSGVGLYYEAVIVAAAIIITHIVLRPIGNRISKTPMHKEGETGEFFYTIQLTCKEHVENHIRALILSLLKNDPHLQLRSLKSRDTDDPVFSRIEARIYASSKHDTEMEKIVASLTLEYGVIEVSWEREEVNNF
ncbi:MAG: MgtC/SapB family protein, partial [Bacteroidia bacterium]|nr:MgtC/SapB family protein [Bacteroidia bacterium]